MADKLPYIKVVEVKNGNNVRYIGGCFVTEGRATCSGDDTFDFNVGKRIAESRAKAKAYAKAAKAWKVKADELFDRDKYIAQHVKDENMYNYEKDESERDFNEFEKTE